jgi:hypothetical protein
MSTKTLSKLLPEPKYQDEKMSSRPLPDAAPPVEGRIVRKASGAPPYGQRSGWIPRTLDDFGDGGAFPEISIAQYPLEMGKKKGVCFHSLYYGLILGRLHLMRFNSRSTRKETSSMMLLFGKVTTVIESFIHPLKTSFLFASGQMWET